MSSPDFKAFTFPGLSEFIAAVNTLRSYEADKDISSFKSDWEGKIRNDLENLYRSAFDENGALNKILKDLDNPDSDGYKCALFGLATTNVPGDFCSGEDDGKPLLPSDVTINPSDFEDIAWQSVFDSGGTVPFFDSDLAPFGTGAFASLSQDSQDEIVAKYTSAEKLDDGRYEYKNTTYSNAYQLVKEKYTDFFVHYETIGNNLFNIIAYEGSYLSEACGYAWREKLRHENDKKEIDADEKMEYINKLDPTKIEYAKHRLDAYKTMIIDLQKQTKIIERYFYSNAEEEDRLNKDPDTAEFSKNASWDGLKVLLDTYSDPKGFFGELVPNWDDNQSADENVEAVKNSLEKEIKEASASVEEGATSYSMARADADEKWLKYNTATKGNPNDLLNLALRYNTASGVGYRLRAIKRETDGTYSMHVERDTITSPTASDVTAERALQNMALPYYVLAVCLEKALAIKDIMTIQMQEVESINEEIKTNNEYLRQANRVYEEYYNCCVEDGTSRDQIYDSGNQALDDYVTHVCGYEFSSKGLHYRVYNTEGGTDTGGSYHYNNVDVVEQGNLTKLSNGQEAIRMYGDTLSTKSQMKVTALQQAIQNYNTCITICSQLARSIMEPYKSLANNIRY